MADVAGPHVKFPEIVIGSRQQHARRAESAPRPPPAQEVTPRSLISDASKNVFISSSKKVQRSHTAPAALDNPFRIPTQVELADLERERARERAEARAGHLSMHDRPTAAFLNGTTRLKFRDLEADLDDDEPEDDPSARIDVTLPRAKNRDREPIPHLKAKKREMFMLEYSLKVKREEMTKIERSTQEREEALRRSEKMLEEDAGKFDAILKENNSKTLEATRKADHEAKLKIEKIQEIKRLNNDIASVKNELAKLDEQLEECKRNKDFLTQLTPQDMIDAAKAKKEQGAQPAEDAELPMHFTEPQQMLEIFKQLEENNMFLIQNSQESERVLEELRVKRKETERRMEGEISGLRSQIATLKSAIAREEDKFYGLEGFARMDLGVDSQDVSLEEIQERIEPVYGICVDQADAHLGTLLMLTRIEKTMVEIFDKLEQMPKDLVQQMEKVKEKERRARARSVKLDIARKAQEQRIKRALERSQAPTKKRVGKPPMLRSVLVTKKKEENHDDRDAEEEEERRYYFD